MNGEWVYLVTLVVTLVICSGAVSALFEHLTQRRRERTELLRQRLASEARINAMTHAAMRRLYDATRQAEGPSR